ncbi:unnamed protein product [Caenorhabditis auriculariae]|uniref:Uncharacterized protein n=1 Tax=Caenorhabditis auriculariae TaxID=2777116 RepID=A0A8S1GXH9_9PELO|nr:unnamed protein product [Caenorhabditis auriculariae]
MHVEQLLLVVYGLFWQQTSAIDDGDSFSLGNLSWPLSNEPLTHNFSLLDVYSPLLAFVVELNTNETAMLLDLIDNHSLSELKYQIDEMRRGSKLVANESISAAFHPNAVQIVESYHNAAIFNALRCLWARQLQKVLPVIDQFVVLHYFGQSPSIWSRLWNNFRMLFKGQNELFMCQANDPPIVKNMIESMEMEELVALDEATSADDFDVVFDTLQAKVKSDDSKAKNWSTWLSRIGPPKPLLNVFDEMSDAEKE